MRTSTDASGLAWLPLAGSECSHTNHMYDICSDVYLALQITAQGLFFRYLQSVYDRQHLSKSLGTSSDWYTVTSMSPPAVIELIILTPLDRVSVGTNTVCRGRCFFHTRVDQGPLVIIPPWQLFSSTSHKTGTPCLSAASSPLSMYRTLIFVDVIAMLDPVVAELHPSQNRSGRDLLGLLSAWSPSSRRLLTGGFSQVHNAALSVSLPL